MSVKTWDVLKRIGFVEDTGIDWGGPVLSIRLGPYRIEAAESVNQWFAEVITLGGVLSNGRAMALIESNLPREVDSDEQGLAFLTYYLDDTLSSFLGAQLPPWIEEGRRHRDL